MKSLSLSEDGVSSEKERDDPKLNQFAVFISIMDVYSCSKFRDYGYQTRMGHRRLLLQIDLSADYGSHSISLKAATHTPRVPWGYEVLQRRSA